MPKIIWIIILALELSKIVSCEHPLLNSDVPVMDFLQFLISPNQSCNFILQIFHFLHHHCPLSLQVDLLLVKFLIIYQIFLDEDAAAVVEGRFSLFQQILVYLQIDQLLPQQLIFLQYFIHLILYLDLRDQRPALLQFHRAHHRLLRGKQIRAFCFSFHVLNDQQQAFILIVEVLYLDFHLINFGGFEVALEALDGLLLRLYNIVELFDLVFEPDDESMVVALYIILYEQFPHLLRLLYSIHGILLSKNTIFNTASLLHYTKQYAQNNASTAV